MSRPVRVVVVVVAWLLPATWVACALAAGPSDGTVVWSSTPTGGDRWGAEVTVQRTFGSTPLREGDIIRTIDGVPFGDWVAGTVAAPGGRSVGDVVPYQVRRTAPGLDRIIDLDVPLTRYPVGPALADGAAMAVAAVLLLLAGTTVWWRRPSTPVAWAFLAGSALVTAGVTSVPWGLGAIDLAGSRGVWPHVGGQIAVALGLGMAVLAAATLGAPHDGQGRRRWLLALVPLVPLVGYALWVPWATRALDPGAARVQALLTIVPPALAVAVPAVLGTVTWTYLRARSREVRLASRLVLVTLLAGLAGRLVLGDLPARVGGEPLLPWPVLLLLITPAVLAGLVIGVLGYRLEEIEPTVRRTLVQALVAVLVATAFFAVAAAIGRVADTSVQPLLAGGAVALLVLPVAIALQRLVLRTLYGDRDLPRRIVSELRRLDPGAAPTETLTETLELLARRLRLAHARIEITAMPDSAPVVAVIGEPRGRPVIVDLVAHTRTGEGKRLGSLHLEAALQRDPFGRADRRLIEDVGSEVGTLVQAILANRELQLSRERLVTAREEERRRLRRELHDGLGPSLATMALRLEGAQDLIEADRAGAAEIVARLSDLAREEIAEVRRLVDDLRPAALDQLGLVSALRERAAQHNPAGNGADPSTTASPTWSVVADDDVEPLPAAVEVAAYRIALEAVTNAVRHSGGRRCLVTLTREDGGLRLRVRDDGRGLAPGAVAGVGLSSMRERAEELGGRCVVSSDDTGTLVEAWVPLARAPNADASGG